MGLTFLDEEPAQAKRQGEGLTFEDGPKPQGVTFVDEVGTKPALPDLERRFSDLGYKPTQAEFSLYRRLKDAEPVQWGKLASTAVDAAGTVASDLLKGAKAYVTKPIGPLNHMQTAAEAVTRGTFDLGMMMRPLLRDDAEHFTDLDEEYFTGLKLDEMNRNRPVGPDGSPLPPITAQSMDLAAQREVARNFRNYKEGRDYERFLEERRLQLARQMAREGRSTLLPQVMGIVQPEIAEAASYVMDPTAVVSAATGGGATVAKAAPSMLRRAAGEAVEASGKAMQKAGAATTAVAKVPERIAGGATRILTGSDEAAKAVEKTVSAGALPATVVSPVVAVPGVTEAATAITAAKATGKGLEFLGDSAQAAGRALPQTPSRAGIFERMAKDGAAPDLTRKASKAIQGADPVIKAAGAVAEDATRGAAMGAAIGGATSGTLEGAASGAGSGLVLGPLSGPVGRLGADTGKTAEAADVNRWLESKSPEEAANIKKLNLTHAETVRLADLESLARGVVDPKLGGDIEFRYVTDADFRKQFGDGKGAQIVEGERPVVVINTDYKGPRSALHETLHALYRLDAAQPERAEINRRLFDQVSGDQVLSRGLFNADDVQAFESQYRARLTPEQRALWDLDTPENRFSKIREEVAAESFANLFEGGGPNRLRDASGIKQRIADSMRMAADDTFLGRMRGALEKVGVKFSEEGMPSDMFTKGGKPISNSPEVNAALRDYVRAKNRATSRLMLNEDESPDVVIRPEDLSKKGNKALVEAFKDSDLFAKNPDGSVRTIGGNAEKAKKAQAELSELKKRVAESDKAAKDAKAAEEKAQAELLRVEELLRKDAEKAKQSKSRVESAESKLLREKAREERLKIKQLNREARERERLAKEQQKEAEAKEKQLRLEEQSGEGQPVLLSEKEIQQVQARRVELMLNALAQAGDDGSPGAVKPKANGAWEGNFFSAKQLAALEALPADILSPSMKEKLKGINELMAKQDGSRILIDYNAALKGRRYSSGIAASTRVAVPLGMHISKAGNFYITTLDVTHFHRKLGDWARNKKGHFSLWEGDVNAFTRDVFKYLENHAAGRPGAEGLDADQGAAVRKRNLINQFFGVTSEGANPLFNESARAKDNLLRSRRFDRINRVDESEGQKMPVDYGRLKMNLRPAGPKQERLP